ncbi:MAG: hypothetical protein IPH45_14460 [Bacteroidales bacterium]|nr:hypothetical protein [Bacteroidales bacterium]
MALFSIPNVRMAGISAAVPRKEVSNLDYKWVSVKDREMLVKTVGVENGELPKRVLPLRIYALHLPKS